MTRKKKPGDWASIHRIVDFDDLGVPELTASNARRIKQIEKTFERYTAAFEKVIDHMRSENLVRLGKLERAIIAKKLTEGMHLRIVYRAIREAEVARYHEASGREIEIPQEQFCYDFSNFKMNRVKDSDDVVYALVPGMGRLYFRKPDDADTLAKMNSASMLRIYHDHSDGTISAEFVYRE